MPYKSDGKWKWGNIERKSKEDLRKVVYGIWVKNGSKGSFSNFWEKGKVSESMSNIVFSKVEKANLRQLFSQIEEYVENERFNRQNFEKYLQSKKTIDDSQNSMFYGVFSVEDGKCLALSYLNKTPAGCVLVAEIQCIFHGYGKVLLQNIIDRCSAVWLVANPEGGQKLLDYYRTFSLEEVSIDRSKWANGEEQHFFFNADDEVKRSRILSTINNARYGS